MIFYDSTKKNICSKDQNKAEIKNLDNFDGSNDKNYKNI